ncbi:MAG: hypothetical protein O2887_05045 [Bacteroidetes bacterium]|nr:hypothetical protein [Bacteroidota bacterium]
MKFFIAILFIPIFHFHLDAQNTASNFIYDFETTQTMPNLSGFGMDIELAENQKLDKNNMSLLTGRVNRSKGKTWDWAGIYIDLPFYMDLSKTQIISLKILCTTRTGIVNVKLENNRSHFPPTEIQTRITKLKEWEQLFFDFRNVDSTYRYNRLTIFVDYQSFENDVYFIDDIKFGL